MLEPAISPTSSKEKASRLTWPVGGIIILVLIGVLIGALDQYSSGSKTNSAAISSSNQAATQNAAESREASSAKMIVDCTDHVTEWVAANYKKNPDGVTAGAMYDCVQLLDRRNALASLIGSKEPNAVVALASEADRAAKLAAADVALRDQAAKQEVHCNALRKEHKIFIGMKADDVTCAWGKPEDINRTVGSWGVHEQWVYGNTYLYLEDGVVTSFQD